MSLASTATLALVSTVDSIGIHLLFVLFSQRDGLQRALYDEIGIFRRRSQLHSHWDLLLDVLDDFGQVDRRHNVSEDFLSFHLRYDLEIDNVRALDLCCLLL